MKRVRPRDRSDIDPRFVLSVAKISGGFGVDCQPREKRAYPQPPTLGNPEGRERGSEDETAPSAWETEAKGRRTRSLAENRAHRDPFGGERLQTVFQGNWFEARGAKDDKKSLRGDLAKDFGGNWRNALNFFFPLYMKLQIKVMRNVLLNIVGFVKESPEIAADVCENNSLVIAQSCTHLCYILLILFALFIFYVCIFFYFRSIWQRRWEARKAQSSTSTSWIWRGWVKFFWFGERCLLYELYGAGWGMNKRTVWRVRGKDICLFRIVLTACVTVAYVCIIL